MERPRTRREWLKYVKDVIGEYKKAPQRMSDTETEEKFEDYLNDNEVFVGYSFKGGYILAYSDIVFDELIYNILVTEKDPEDIIAELDFDDEDSFRDYIVNELHLTL